MNDRAREYLGWWPEMRLDDIWRAVVHPDDAPRVRRTWLQAVHSGTNYAADYRLRRADGTFLCHEGRGLAVRDGGGDITTWVCTATDIDDYKTSQAALKVGSDQLAEAQELAKVGSWVVDATGKRTWSDEMYRLLDYEPGEVEASPDRLFDRLHPADADRMRAAVLGPMIRPDPWEQQFRVVRSDGALRWVTARTEPVLGESGETVAVHATVQDVTERKLAEEQLQFQADLLDAVGEAVIATDLGGTVMYWGPGTEDLYGWTATEVQGRCIVDLIPATVQGKRRARAGQRAGRR